MKKQTLLLAVLAAMITTSSIAQTAPTPPVAAKEENITIRKKGDSKEKLVIVIENGKITVNGEPVTNLKTNNLEITRGYGNDLHITNATPPPAIAGYNRNFNFSSNNNNAMLGIMPTDDDKGAKITEVTKGSSAEKAGLQKGDIITKIDDDEINDANDVYDAIGDHKPQDKVTITYQRNNKEQTASAVLDKSKSKSVTFNSVNSDVFKKGLLFNQNFTFSTDDKPRLGLRAQDTEDGKGVTVKEIGDDESPAAKAGLKEDDIITQVNGKNVTSLKDIRDLIDTVKPGDNVQIQYKRGTALQTATVHFPKQLETSDL